MRTALTSAGHTMTTLHVDHELLEEVVAHYPGRARARGQHRLPARARTIRVIEHHPAALVELGGDEVPVAGDGTVLRGMPVEGRLPVIDTEAAARGERLTSSAALHAARVAGAAPAILRSRVETIGARKEDGVVVQLHEGPELIFGDGTARACQVDRRHARARRPGGGGRDLHRRAAARPAGGRRAARLDGDAGRPRRHGAGAGHGATHRRPVGHPQAEPHRWRHGAETAPATPVPGTVPPAGTAPATPPGDDARHTCAGHPGAASGSRRAGPGSGGRSGRSGRLRDSPVTLDLESRLRSTLDLWSRPMSAGFVARTVDTFGECRLQCGPCGIRETLDDRLSFGRWERGTPSNGHGQLPRGHQGRRHRRRRHQRRQPHGGRRPQGRRVHRRQHRRPGAADVRRRHQAPDRRSAHARARRRARTRRSATARPTRAATRSRRR